MDIDTPDPKPKRQLSPERRFIFYLGLASLVCGLLLCFGALASGFISTPNYTSDDPPALFAFFLVGMVLFIAGPILMGLGHSGAAGSGLIPDPEQARRDLEPWNRSVGGQLADALDEVKPLNDIARRLTSGAAPPASTAVKLRCRECRALADETARFCPQCGKPL